MAGTTTANSFISLSSDDNTYLFNVLANGNVGIGLTTPIYPLQIRRATNINIGFGQQNSGISLEAVNDAVNANIPMSYYASAHYLLNGNVGIGVTTPASVLTVQKNTSGGRGGEISIVNYATVAVGNEAALNFGVESSTYDADNGNFQLKAIVTATNAATDGVFSTWNGSAFGERMRITSGGNVLIGTATDNGCRLQAVGSGTVASFNDTSSGDVTITLLANGTFRGGLGADANYALKITGVGGTQVAVINASTGAYTATSDRTLKKNISDSPLALPVLNQIKIRQYNWKSNDSVEQYGVIAQELYEVAPTYVSKPKKETDKWGVSKAELVPLLIKAIQEQQAQIEELKALIK